MPETFDQAEMTPLSKQKSNSLTLLVATGNQKKLKELEALLGDLHIGLLGLKDFQNLVEVEEDGLTFQENAVKKALGFARQTGCLTLAEDSGLSIDYLNGEPGVFSARFAGLEKDDLKNCEKVLESLKNVPDDKRGAAFHCAVALALPDKVISVFEKTVSGFISHAMMGDGGFGYDPLFFYPEFGKTFAQVPAEMKHSVSHRGKALRKLKEFLKEYLRKGPMTKSQ